MAPVERRVRVAILTTQWLATVLRIKEETNGRRSVMCLNLTSTETGVTREYHRFVSRDTGVVAERTGVDVYRLDVDRDISEGTSFQLGAYIAHVLHRDGRLAGRSENSAGDEIVLATGQVDDEFQVRAVDRITQKLRVVEEWLESMPLDTRIRLVLPAENRRDAEGRLDKIVARGISVLFAEHADDVFGGAPRPRQAIEAPRLSSPRPPEAIARTPEGGVPKAVESRGHHRRRGGTLALAAVALLVLAAALVMWAFSTPAATAVAGALTITVTDTVSSTGCFDGERRRTTHPVASGGEVVLPSGVMHCRIEVLAVDAASARQVAYVVSLDGERVMPIYLGEFGNVAAALRGDTIAADVAFAPALLQSKTDVARLPQIVIRFDGRPDAPTDR